MRVAVAIPEILRAKWAGCRQAAADLFFGKSNARSKFNRQWFTGGRNFNQSFAEHTHVEAGTVMADEQRGQFRLTNT